MTDEDMTNDVIQERMKQTLFDLIGRLKCTHSYNETSLRRYDVIFGGSRLFICDKCGKEKYFHIPHLRHLDELIKERKKYGKKVKYTLNRIFEDGD